MISSFNRYGSNRMARVDSGEIENRELIRHTLVFQVK